MGLAYQDIPDVDGIINASNAFIVDQGVALFALVVFSIVIFGMMGLMFMMQRQSSAMLRQMGKESNQQDKLITQNDLNRVAAQRNTDEIVDVKDLLAKLIEVQTQGNTDKKTIMVDSLASLDANTAATEKTAESVTTMNEQFKTLEQAIREVLDKVEGGMTLDEKTKNEIIAEVSKNISATVHDCMEKAIKSTQETPVIPTEKPKPKEETEAKQNE